MRALLLLAASVPLFSQLQLTVQTGAGPQNLGTNFQMGATAAGELWETRFRALNTSAAPIPVQSLSVNGAGFSLGAPFQPAVVNPGGAYEFTVRFQPLAPGSYSALLTVNSTTTFLRADAEWAAAIATVLDGQPVPLPAGGLAVDAVAGEQKSIPLVLWNYRPANILVSQLEIAGSGFRVADAPALPVTLEPGQQLGFRLLFTPGTEGSFTGVLQAGLTQRSIIVNATRPRLPEPILEAGASVLRNAMQTPVKVTFPEPAAVDGTGKLRVSFQGSFPDPAIRLSNGALEAEFRITRGSREASFEGQPEIVLQTGTASGTLVVEAVTESGTDRQTWFFAPAPILIDAARAARTPQGLEITLAGFDNTRTAGSLNFRFFDRAGNPLGGVITAALVTEFGSYFRSSDAGGVFQLRAAFPVSGDATMVGSVLIEIANSIGRTELPRLNIP